MTHTISIKDGINYWTDKTEYKVKYFKYRTSFESHGNIDKTWVIQNVKVKYRLYDYKKDHFLNKYSYKTFKGKDYENWNSNVSNYAEYTSNKNWVPFSAVLYMKRVVS